MPITVLAEREAADGAAASTECLAPETVEAATGWTLKPEGLCRGDVCVPVSADQRRGLVAEDGSIRLAGFAEALGARVVTDAAAGAVAVSVAKVNRANVVAGAAAEPFTLPDLDGAPRSLGEWAGKKKLLVCWASW